MQTATAAEDKALKREAQNTYARNFREVGKQRQQNKLLIYGMRDPIIIDYKKCNSNVTDHVRIYALRQGYGCTFCYDVYTAGELQDLDKKDNTKNKKLQKCKHWEGNWNSPRFVKSCTFVQQDVTFQLAILDFFYQPGGTCLS